MTEGGEGLGDLELAGLLDEDDGDTGLLGLLAGGEGALVADEADGDDEGLAAANDLAEGLAAISGDVTVVKLELEPGLGGGLFEVATEAREATHPANGRSTFAHGRTGWARAGASQRAGAQTILAAEALLTARRGDRGRGGGLGGVAVVVASHGDESQNGPGEGLIPVVLFSRMPWSHPLAIGTSSVAVRHLIKTPFRRIQASPARLKAGVRAGG